MEKIWVLGDEFAYKTYEDYFKNNKYNDGSPATYTFEHFEVVGFFNLSFKLPDKCIHSRIRNLVAKGYKGLPKLIVVILDNDITHAANSNSGDWYIFFKIIFHFLMSEVTRVIEAYKELLPNKAKRINIPHVLWIAPPTLSSFGCFTNSK